jgi:hypothetical protein
MDRQRTCKCRDGQQRVQRLRKNENEEKRQAPSAERGVRAVDLSINVIGPPKQSNEFSHTAREGRGMRWKCHGIGG